MQPRAAHTRACIVQAAAELLVEHAGNPPSTNHIAERSGYAIGTLYQHFDNKEAVFAAVMDAVLEPPVAVLCEFEPRATLAESMRALLAEAAGALAGQDPALWRTLEVLPGGEFPRKRQAGKDAAIAGLASLLQAHRNEISPRDLQLAARMLIASIEGVALTADQQLFASNLFYQECFRLIYAYLKYEMNIEGENVD